MKKLALFLSFLFVISCSKDPIIYTLTTSANPAEGGTVSPSSATFEEGQTATITASPSSDYLFQSWSGATGSTNSTSVVMNSDKTVTAGKMSTVGFGSIDKSPNQRSREDYKQYSFLSSVNAGQLLPEKWKIQLPVSYSISEEFTTPEQYHSK